MLIETDINELGDKRLDPKEGVAMQREKCLQAASRYRIDQQDELSDERRSQGVRLSSSQLLARLEKLVPGLKGRDGYPGNLALYYPRTEKQLYEALVEGGANDEFFIFHRYVGGFSKDDLPEWGYVDLDTSLIATREHLRGWRTVLIGLMHAGILSYQDAIQEFGDPAGDQRSKIWMQKTLEWRQNPSQKFTLSQFVEAQRR